MRVKRYVVDSMPDALQKIRSDLGKDAVILNTKEIRSGGFLGLFGKKKIEVIAAVDGPGSAPGSGARQTAPRAAAARAPAAPRPAAPVAILEPEQLSFPEVPDVLPPAKPAQQPEPAAEPKGAPPPPQVSAAGVYSPPKPAPAKSREDLLFEELKQMREMMQKLSLQAGGGEAAVPVTAPRVRERLAEQEVDPLLVDMWLDRAKADADELGEPLTESLASRSVRSQMAGLLRMEGHKAIAPQTKIAHFVGPTGVGKTTTIAKLAAEQVLKHRRKVGFITSDTYRISAVEQLRTYANILNVPLEVVFSPQDLLKAFAALEDCDLIFMDTAGRNFRNEMYVSELNTLLRTQGDSETYLVLSLTTKYKDMKAITGNFTKFKLDKVLFTKMDETDSYGAVVNLVHDFGLQLSYVADGQNVPDDIAELDEQKLIDSILEELPDE
ncbi:flagellar biosynthesis regulator FlhF [Gordoniibacillus kamchatkensis]|uniref:Flagellar biosynthesis protein FlhF n=1 Tax=Gordoniibacillus kamchatkensis TaxID=1590651 RepID=A0ABR5AE38_9BACL|nr:flagellar biosynthesis protein FlhF [Paenibacillus sp. VKM B-2647]KIL39231.1 flagellar biosynthesis regulator FlhF [Paenibacillus sp. VKM B-2647]